MAEFNGDGRIDLAVANYGGYGPPYNGSVSVFLGRGDGTFGAATDYPTGDASWELRAADLNGDGKVDLVVANYGADGPTKGSVSVLLSNGDGTFQQSLNYRAGIACSATAIADFDGDGVPDLAVADWDSAAVSILHGNGDGTFGARSVLPVNSVPKELATQDFNHDGRPDLVVANYGDSTVSVLIATGTGFQPKVDYVVGPDPTAVVAADLDHDGNADIAASRVLEGGISILFGNGDGRFGRRETIPGPWTNTWEMTSGDVNGDGNLDLITANSVGTTTVYLGDGVGGFTSQSYCAGSEPMSASVGDINGDGQMDLAVACNGGNPGVVAVLLGDGSGAYGDTTCVEPEDRYAALGLSPNPSHGAFVVGFSLQHDGPVNITVYDVRGRKVAVTGESIYEAGSHSVQMDVSSWNVKSRAGVYFVRLVSREATTMQKLVIIQ